MARSKIFGTGSERSLGAGVGGLLQGYLTGKQMQREQTMTDLEKAKLGLEATKEARGYTMLSPDGHGGFTPVYNPGADPEQLKAALGVAGINLPNATEHTGAIHEVRPPTPQKNQGGRALYFDEGARTYHDAAGNTVTDVTPNDKVTNIPAAKPVPQPGILSRIGSSIGDFFNGGQPAAPVATPSAASGGVTHRWNPATGKVEQVQ